MNTNTLSQIALLDKRVKAAEALIEMLKERRKALEEGMILELAEAGMTTVRLDGEATKGPAHKLLLSAIYDDICAGGVFSVTADDGSTLGTLVGELIDGSETMWRTMVNPLGKRTVYLNQETYASAAPGSDGQPDTDRLCEVLRNYSDADGNRPYENLVKTTVHHKTLSALVKEFADRGEALPAPLAGAIKVSEVTKLKSRKA